MSKDNHNQGSIMEEIWGGRIWDRRADRRDVCGGWVNCKGRRPHSNLRPECCIKAYSQRCVSSTVTSVQRAGEGFNMELNTCCLRRRTVSAVHLDTVLPDTVTLGFHVLYCWSHRIRHLGCTYGWLPGKWSFYMFVCLGMSRQNVCFCLFLPSLWY